MSTHGGPDLGFEVHSLGCKVSRIDAEAVAASLEGAGLVRGGSPDLLVLQTCSVTDRADRDARRAIRALRRRHPGASLVVTGCLAQRDPEGLARMAEVDGVAGHAAPGAVARFALEVLRSGEGAVAWSPTAAFGALSGLPRVVDPERTRAFLKIQDGCRRRCAFCVVPSLRGGERSVPPGEVEAEIRRLGDDGIAEVVLSGIHLAAFGGARGGGLLALLRRLERRPPRCRVRLSSVEPMEAGEELVRAVVSSGVVAPHLHLPLQSGSDAVLRRMRRGLTAARYRKLVEAACSGGRAPHLATDLIAGFPGESDAEFEETRRLVEELPFASLHVFPFSPRDGTEAAAMHARSAVPAGTVTSRARLLRELGDRKARDFAARVAGTIADVVALRGGRGLTGHYLEVPLKVPPADRVPGRRFAARLLPTGAGGALEAHPC